MRRWARRARFIPGREPTYHKEVSHETLTSIGPGGFEPPLTDPKSAVLPLDEGPVHYPAEAGS